MLRYPAVEKKISEIRLEEDRRVRLIGTVITKDADNGLIVVDDGTAKVNVYFDRVELVEKLGEYKEGQLVTVVGLVVQVPGGFDISGEVIKGTKLPNLELKGKVDALWKKFRLKLKEESDQGTNQGTGQETVQQTP